MLFWECRIRDINIDRGVFIFGTVSLGFIVLSGKFMRDRRRRNAGHRQTTNLI